MLSDDQQRRIILVQENFLSLFAQYFPILSKNIMCIHVCVSIWHTRKLIRKCFDTERVYLVKVSNGLVDRVVVDADSSDEEAKIFKTTGDTFLEVPAEPSTSFQSRKLSSLSV